MTGRELMQKLLTFENLDRPVFIDVDYMHANSEPLVTEYDPSSKFYPVESISEGHHPIHPRRHAIYFG